MEFLFRLFELARDYFRHVVPNSKVLIWTGFFSLIKDMNLPPNIHLGKNQIFHSESDMFYWHWCVDVCFQKVSQGGGRCAFPNSRRLQEAFSYSCQAQTWNGKVMICSWSLKFKLRWNVFEDLTPRSYLPNMSLFHFVFFGFRQLWERKWMLWIVTFFTI